MAYSLVGSNRAWFDTPAFTAGDVVTVEVERAPGADGLLRVRVDGKRVRELRGSPSDGLLYPIVSLYNTVQSIAMVAQSSRFWPANLAST